MASVRKRTWISGGVKKTAFVVTYTDQDGNRIQDSTHERRSEAKRRKLEIEDGIEKGTHTPHRNSPPLWQAALDRVEYQVLRKKMRPGRADCVRSRILNHIKNTELGRTPIAKIKAKQVSDFYKDLLQKAHDTDEGWETARDTTGIVKTTLKHAHAHGALAQNVAASVTVTSTRTAPKYIDVDIPRKDEEERMLAHASERWRPLLTVAFRTGMRPSEYRALRWKDVDLDAGLISVRRSADPRGNIGDTKTPAARRKIPITPECRKALIEQANNNLNPDVIEGPGYRHVKEARLARDYGRMPDKPIMTVYQYQCYQKHFNQLESLAKVGRWDLVRAFEYPVFNKSGYVTRLYLYRDDLLAAHEFEVTHQAIAAADNITKLTIITPDDLVFPNTRGKPQDMKTLQEVMDEAQFAAGVTKLNGSGNREAKYSLYAMRHFYASWLIDQGFQAEEVKDLMGHEHIDTIYNHYIHLFPDRKAGWHDRLADAEAALNRSRHVVPGDATKTRHIVPFPKSI